MEDIAPLVSLVPLLIDLVRGVVYMYSSLQVVSTSPDDRRVQHNVKGPDRDFK
jgi:hypothetical protein